jgi:hypothetical protein
MRDIVPRGGAAVNGLDEKSVKKLGPAREIKQGLTRRS